MGQTDFCGAGKFAIKRFYASDTLHLTCDTAYLFNKATYGLYKRLYLTSGTQDQKIKALLSSYDYMKTLYENRIAEQDLEYNQLHVRFDSLVSNSQNFIQSASENLTDVKKSITIANENIIVAQRNLELTEKNLKADMITSKKRMLQWGIGGFTLGVVTTAVLILAIN